jgi:hypothetical protein
MQSVFNDAEGLVDDCDKHDDGVKNLSVGRYASYHSW